MGVPDGVRETQEGGSLERSQGCLGKALQELHSIDAQHHGQEEAASLSRLEGPGDSSQHICHGLYC